MAYDNSLCTVGYLFGDFFGHALPMGWAYALAVLAEEDVRINLCN